MPSGPPTTCLIRCIGGECIIRHRICLPIWKPIVIELMMELLDFCGGIVVVNVFIIAKDALSQLQPAHLAKFLLNVPSPLQVQNGVSGDQDHCCLVILLALAGLQVINSITLLQCWVVW